VSPAIEISSYLRHVNGLAGRASYQLYVFVQFHQDEESGRLEEIAQLVGQGGNFLNVAPSAGGGDDHRLAVEFMDLAMLQ